MPAENTALVIGLAIAFFGGVAALAGAAGLFEKLSRDELAALGLFAAAFAALTYVADRQVRGTVDGVIAALRDRSARPGRTPRRPVNIRTGSAS